MFSVVPDTRRRANPNLYQPSSGLVAPYSVVEVNSYLFQIVTIIIIIVVVVVVVVDDDVFVVVVVVRSVLVVCII